MDKHIIVLLTRILYQVTLSKPLNILEGISISQYYWAKQEKSSGCALSDLLSRITLKLKRGHSIIMWTKFYPDLTTYPIKRTIVDILHNTYPIYTCIHPKIVYALVLCIHLTKNRLSTDHLPTPSCPRSYWMTPKAEKLKDNCWWYDLIWSF